MTMMKHEAATDVATFAPSNKESLPETKALLNQVVADLYVAHIALHQVHWYMRGRGFPCMASKKWMSTWKLLTVTWMKSANV